VKASKLIKRLNKLMKKHGDVAVYFRDSDDDFGDSFGILVGAVEAYDSTGDGPTKDRPAVQIYMH
jgi:hypothetical protein